jgi:hypothetical protein
MNTNNSNNNYQDQLFRKEVNFLIKSNDRILFKNIMHEKNYPFLSKKEKENYIFQTTLSLSKFYVSVDNFLQYLIFEYNINEEYYTKVAHPNGYKPVEDMFAKRKFFGELNQELNTELHLNSNAHQNTRIKV